MTKPLPLPECLISDPEAIERYAARINSRVDWPDDPLACWEWTGYRQHYGHGSIPVGLDNGKYRNVMVHRILYGWKYEDQPLPLDHLCGNTGCVNPDHVRPATVRENTLRGEAPSAINAQKDRCINGHPLYGDNVYASKNGKRRCKACSQEASNRWKEKVDYSGGGAGTRKYRLNGPLKTHCKNGHPWTSDNIYYRKRGHTECRTCHREREARRQQRMKAAG